MRPTLAEATEGRVVRIASVALDDDVASWLAAVGLHLGEEIVVLRRAILGGPMHVRTGSGGEFAVARELAAKIAVDVVDAVDARRGDDPVPDAEADAEGSVSGEAAE